MHTLLLTLITLVRSEVDEASDLAVTGVVDKSSSLISEPKSPSSILVEKSRTMLFSLSITTLLTRLVTSAISVTPDLFSPSVPEESHPIDIVSHCICTKVTYLIIVGQSEC